MFRPLAWTKTLAVGSSSIIAITLVPVLMVMLIRGKLKPESANPISRITQAIYLPVLRICLKYRKLTIAVNLLFLAATLPSPRLEACDPTRRIPDLQFPK